MSCIISLEKLTEIVVNIDKDLFEKYEKGIRTHFTEYMERKYSAAIRKGQVDMEKLGIGIHALRDSYMTKNSGDYGSQDCAEFSLDGHNRFTAQYRQLTPVEKKMKGYYDDPDFIRNVYVKRSAVTGRLVPCVDQKTAEDFLSLQKTSENVEKQLEKIEALIDADVQKQDGKTAFEGNRVINLIAERTAEIILSRMKLSQAV
jgi:hypothetical protein